jgi:hypothetical protein
MSDVANITVGDVIQDHYGNAAVVLTVADGRPKMIIQVVGSDRGNVCSAPTNIIPVTSTSQIKWARKVARSEWVRRGLKRSQFQSN